MNYKQSLTLSIAVTLAVLFLGCRTKKDAIKIDYVPESDVAVLAPGEVYEPLSWTNTSSTDLWIATPRGLKAMLRRGYEVEVLK